MAGNDAIGFHPTDEVLRGLARRLAPRDGEADDLAQEVWLAVLRKPRLAERIEWLRIVARRTLWRWSSRERARARRELDVARPAAQASVLDEIETASVQQYLAASVEALKEPYRAVVRLHYLEELPIEEIARRLERPSATVRVQLRRGLETLRARLEARKQSLLGALPLLGAWRALRARWTSGGTKRVAAAGFAALALVFTAFVLVRLERGRAGPAGSGAPAERVASLAAPEAPAGAGRVPITTEESAAARERDARMSLAGRVLTSDGRPVAGAPIHLRDRHGNSRLAAISGGDGRYRVDSADLREWIEARPEGGLPSPRHLVLSVERGRELDLVCAAPSGALRGRVRDALGNVVPGAEVFLRVPLLTSTAGSLVTPAAQDELPVRASYGAQATIEGPLDSVRSATDAQGRFVAPKPPGSRLQVLVRAAGLPAALEMLEVREGEDEELELALPPAARLTGRLLDPDGRPCALARLELRFPEPLPRCETTTDEAGRYRFDGLAPGLFALKVLERRAGTASAQVAGQIAAGEEQALDLELSEENTISGTLAADAGAGGAPLAGWSVSLQELAEGGFPPPDTRETTTASDGRFSFLGCSRSEYALEFFDPAAPARSTRVTAHASRTPLALRPTPSELLPFRGRIVARGGAPRPSLLGLTPAGGLASGRQELVVLDPAEDEFAGPLLARGTYHVDAFFPGCPAAWRKTIELDGSGVTLEIPERGRLRLALELPPERSFDEVSAFVRVRVPLETNWVHAPMVRDPRRQEFSLELPAGTYSAFVLLDGHAAEPLRARIEAGRETVLDVAPKAGASLRVRIALPRALADEEYLHVLVEEAERRVPATYLRRDPGDGTTWWANVDLTADSRKLVARTTGGMAGELELTADLRRPDADARIELREH